MSENRYPRRATKYQNVRGEFVVFDGLGYVEVREPGGRWRGATGIPSPYDEADFDRRVRSGTWLETFDHLPPLPTDNTGDGRFKITWRDGQYYVSRPNVDTMEVVPLAEYERLERERDEAIQAFKTMREAFRQSDRKALFTWETFHGDEIPAKVRELATAEPVDNGKRQESPSTLAGHA